MNTPSSRTVGARSSAARSRSLSSRRIMPRGWAARARASATSTPVALPAPPVIGFTGSPAHAPPVRGSRLVDLLELALRPLHRVLGLRALTGLGIHVDDDVLRVRLGGLGRRRPRVAQHAGLARRLPEHLQGLVDLRPHRMVLPDL